MVAKPEGGYFLWIKFEKNVKEYIFEGVDFHPGNKFTVSNDKDRFNNYGRLCFARYNLEDLKEGALRLCKSLKKL